MRAICISEAAEVKRKSKLFRVKRELQLTPKSGQPVKKPITDNVMGKRQRIRAVASGIAELAQEKEEEEVGEEKSEQDADDSADYDGDAPEGSADDSDEESFEQAAEASARHFADRKEHLLTAPIDDAPKYRMMDSHGKILDYSHHYLDELVEWKSRSYTTYDPYGN